MNLGPRGSGNTTSQIRNAPRDSLYIVMNEACVQYTKVLADRLSRYDLRIVSKYSLFKLRGVSFSAIVIDHAVCLNETEREIVASLSHRFRPAQEDSFEKELDNFLDWLNFK